MGPVIIDGTLNIRVIWTFDGADLAINVLNANIGPSPSVNQAMADTIAGHAGDAHDSSDLNTLQPTDLVLDRVDIRDVRSANQPLISATVNSAGTDTDDLLPRGNALVVTSRTALAGRSFRGRTYVPGFSDVATESTGLATSAARDAAVALPLLAGCGRLQLLVTSRDIAVSEL
jgi:hypothetical protein